jgi:hypothetical protein
MYLSENEYFEEIEIRDGIFCYFPKLPDLTDRLKRFAAVLPFTVTRVKTVNDWLRDSLWGFFSPSELANVTVYCLRYDPSPQNRHKKFRYVIQFKQEETA